MKTKPSGWRGKKTDSYWTKHTAYGVRYMCAECGRNTLGIPMDHWPKCSRDRESVANSSTGAKIIDLFEALKQSIQPKAGEP